MFTNKPARITAAALIAVGMIAIPVIEAVIQSRAAALRVVICGTLTLLILFGGALLLRRAQVLTPHPATRFHSAALVYLGALTLPWAVVIVDTPHASYFLFVLIGITMWLLPPTVGNAASTLLTIFTVAGQVVHHGFSAGALVGPLLALTVLVIFNMMYRAIVSESDAKTRALQELKTTQTKLAESERRTGQLTERSRLGRELHDTVAQSLSSIQLLLQLAQDNPETRAANINAAREAAALALTETRSFITELTPPDLETGSLRAALQRVVERAQTTSHSRSTQQGTLETQFTLVFPETVPQLPMRLEAALLRGVQASLENVLAHSAATTCDIRVWSSSVEAGVEIDDNGVGFDDSLLTTPHQTSTSGFGLPMLSARMAELGGSAVIVTAPGEGTLVRIVLPLQEE